MADPSDDGPALDDVDNAPPGAPEKRRRTDMPAQISDIRERVARLEEQQDGTEQRVTAVETELSHARKDTAALLRLAIAILGMAIVLLAGIAGLWISITRDHVNVGHDASAPPWQTKP